MCEIVCLPILSDLCLIHSFFGVRKQLKEYIAENYWSNFPELKSFNFKWKEIQPSRIAGIGEATSKAFKDSTRIFSSKGFSSSETFPYRIKVKLDLVLEKPLEFKPLIPKLSFIKNKKRWTGHIMGKAMRRIPKEDYETIVSTTKEARVS